MKDKDDVTTQYTGKSRHAAITQAKGPRFSFDTQEGMHVSLGERGADPPSEEEREIIAEMYTGPEGIGGFSWTECVRENHGL